MTNLHVNGETALLGNVCENLDSKRIPITKAKRVNGDIPYYGASGIVDYVAEYIFNENLLLVSEDGANLLARTYPIAFSISGKTWVNNHAHVLRFKDMISQRFIEYYLNSISLKPYVSGMAQPKLNQTSLNTISVPFPPLPEQKRIVAILDEAFAGISQAVANVEKNIANARELFESYLNGVFTLKGKGWTTRPLSDLCYSDTVVTYGVIKLGKEVSDGIPCLRTSNVRWLYIDKENIKRIAPKLSDKYKRTILYGGEVLVNVRGTLGGVAVATQEMEGWNVSREVAVVPADPSLINPKYLSYWIGTKTSQDWLTWVQKGVAYTGINLSDLRKLPVAFPDMDEQSLIVDRLDQMISEVRLLDTIYQKKIIAINELRQSILQNAFTGELTSSAKKVAV